MKKMYYFLSLMIFFSSVFIVDLSAQSQVKTKVRNSEFEFHSADRNTTTAYPKALLISEEELVEDKPYHSKIIRTVAQENEDTAIKYIYFEKGRVEIYPFRLKEEDDIFSTLLVADREMF